MMTEQEVKQLLIDTQAILEGHFLLTSGLHSPMYVEKFNVLQHPKYTEKLCKELAERFTRVFGLCNRSTDNKARCSIL